MRLFDQPYYKFSKANISRIGVWPEQSKYVRIIWPLMMLVMILTVAGPMVIRLRDIHGDLDTVIISVTILLLGLITCVMILNLMLKVDKIKVMLEDMEKHWTMCNDTSAVIVFAKYAERGNNFVIFFSIFAYATMAVYLTIPTLPILLDFVDPLNESRPREYVFEVEYGVDSDKYYWLIMAHAYIVGIVAVNMLVAFETVYIMLTVHACAFFEVVIFAERIESIFSGCSVVALGTGVILISLTGVLILMNVRHPVALFRAANYAFAQVFHLFLNILPGQQLIDHSIKIHTLAYDLDWYNMSVKTQKLWILILIRSSRPCLITIAKVYTLSMESFSSTMQTALSYFMVLAQVL